MISNCVELSVQKHTGLLQESRNTVYLVDLQKLHSTFKVNTLEESLGSACSQVVDVIYLFFPLSICCALIPEGSSAPHRNSLTPLTMGLRRESGR